MTLPMVTCPLCCRPGFSSSESLCTALVDVTTRKLSCPICNHEVSGLDKFTIHLFSHSLTRFGSIRTKDSSQISQTEINKTYYDNSCNVAIGTEQIHNSNNTDKLSCNFIEDTSISSCEKQDTWVGGSIPVKYSKTKSIPFDGSLIYFRTDNGQLFAISHENLGSSLKNVTINTQNYITSTNITTSTLQTNLIGNVQKRKYSHIFDKDNSTMNTKNLDECLQKCPEMFTNGESVHSYPSTTNVCSEVDKCIKSDFEFESCKDLLTKGDFTTNGDDISDLEITESNMENNVQPNKNVSEDIENKSKESTTCELCSYVFPNKTILAMHNQLVHKKVETGIDSKRKLLLCNLCTRTFSLRSSLMIHRRVAHAGGFGNNDNSSSSKQLNHNLSSQVGGKCINKDIQLSQNMKVQEEKQWQCSICAKGFTTKYFLKKHRRLHTGEMPYRCKTCSKSFTFQQTYRKHLLYHNNDKPYCCAQCGRLFKELSTLHNHERIHSGEKPFTCETCGKAFRQRVSYLVHRRIHTGAMPYKCTSCNKSFRYKISQRTHKCTAQPPGVVVRTQGYLVHRLQAAMNKVTNENQNADKEMNVEDSSPDKSKILSSINHTSDKTSLLSVDENCSTLSTFHDNTSKETNSLQKGQECSKVKTNKPQIYLLVKGLNGETYYQPLIMSQTLAPSNVQNNLEVGVDTIPPKSPKVPNSVSSEKVIHNNDLHNMNHNSPTDKTVAVSIPEFTNLFGIKSTPGNSAGAATKSDENRNSAIFKLKSGEMDESKNCNSSQNIEGMFTSETDKQEAITDNIDNSSSIMSELLDSLIYVNNSDNQNMDAGNERKEVTNNNAPVNSDTNSDTVMDSSDLFSFILSPSLSSPSDRFGRLSLSPNSSSITNSLTSDNYDSPSLINCSLSNSEDVHQDTFFENLTDDTLKELLFGGVK